VNKSASITILQNNQGAKEEITDEVTIEEPLEFSIAFGAQSSREIKNIAVTMRTPGNDFELVLGFLYSEGIIKNKSDVQAITRMDNLEDSSNIENTVLVELEETLSVDPQKIRNFYINSSCGICGSQVVDDIGSLKQYHSSKSDFLVAESVLRTLPGRLQQQQDAFSQTGGLHASALFDQQGSILSLFEDVGRHNALDKLIGSELQNNNLPLFQSGLILSGRTSFELIHKAALAGIPVVVSIGAPSSLAVDAAWEYEITLAGFLQADRFNIYSFPRRIN
jgi:FdhD protein|tara:strand:- start:470 stop:1306 length:837 start_codon:yes stop_codon:yes gene_type:complete